MKNTNYFPFIGMNVQGYLVTDVFSSEDTVAVVAHSDTAPDPWVCWSWAWESGMYNGAYCSDENTATLRMCQRITGMDLTTIAAAEGAIIEAVDKLGIKWLEDILSIVDSRLTEPGKRQELEKLAKNWRLA